MPRKAREKAQSGIYHVLLTCLNKKQLFKEKEDKQKYIALLEEYRSVCDFKLYGYCVMDSHIHLLIDENGGDISKIMKRIGTSYVYWFNTKYNRTGPLFEDRYKSEPIETDKDFTMVLRYIFNAPVRYRINKNMFEYEFSSANNYFLNGIIDSENLRRILGGVVEYKEFMQKDGKERFIDVVRKEKCLTDDALVAVIKNEYGMVATDLLMASKQIQLKILVQLLKSYNVPLRQIARVTKLSISKIWRLLAGKVACGVATVSKD